MEAIAAVMTGKGTGAIAVIGVLGGSARAVLDKIFRPQNNNTHQYEKGELILGTICDGDEIIDQVLLGCENDNNFCINCHGNPLIVADIMRLLKDNGARAISAEQMLVHTISKKHNLNSIELEAKITAAKAKSLSGTKIIQKQIDGGLNKTVQHWRNNFEGLNLDQIKSEAAKILETSKKAGYVIYGAKITLAGPPNSGKSTLLNYLAGKAKAIVTNIAGTTRDWVSADCKLGELHCEIIDTAGIDETLFSKGSFADKEAQRKAKALLESSDLVIWVLDTTKINKYIKITAEKIKDKPVITVLNKNDLPAEKDSNKLADSLSISAKFGDGIEELIRKIHLKLDIDIAGAEVAFCFTGRQRKLLEQILASESKDSTFSAISELLNGKVCV